MKYHFTVTINTDDSLTEEEMEEITEHLKELDKVAEVVGITYTT